MERLPEAWIAPPAIRELRELVRHRAKLVGLRSLCKAEVHAVLAKSGIQVLRSDLFSDRGEELLDRVQMPSPYTARVQSLRRLIEDLEEEEEIELFERLTRGRLMADPANLGLQQLPGVGQILAAVFLAEVGEVGRFATAAQLACGAGPTPKPHESDTHTHRGRITKQGSRLVRWAAVESVKRLGPTSTVGAYKKQVADRRGKNIGTVAAAADGSSSSSTRCGTITSGPSTRPGPRHETHDPDGRSRATATLGRGDDFPVTVSGTIACSQDGLATLDGVLRQTQGAKVAQGEFSDGGPLAIPCSPTPTAWSRTVTGGDRKFVAKSAALTITGTACDAPFFLGCDGQTLTRDVVINR
jgi:hypothetical protein